MSPMAHNVSFVEFDNYFFSTPTFHAIGNSTMVSNGSATREGDATYSSPDLTNDSVKVSASTEPLPMQVLLEFLNQYYVPAIAAVGLVGNALSFVVFLFTHLRMRSSSYYLAGLAAADFGFLLALLVVWLSQVGIDLFNKNVGCQTVIYMSSVSSFLSVWLIVSFTVERFIAVQYPLQRPHLCTVRRAKIIVCSLSILALLAHSYLLFTSGMVSRGDKVECGLRSSFYDMMKVLNIVDTVLTLIIPFVLITFMNFKIAKELHIFSKKYRNTAFRGGMDSSVKGNEMKENSNPGSQGSNNNISKNKPDRRSGESSSGSSSGRNQQALAAQRSTEHRVSSGRPTRENVLEFTTPQNQKLLSAQTQFNITKMLLLISTVFIFLNLPSYVLRIYSFFKTDLHHDKTIIMIQQFSMLLYYTNFSVNFLLYSTYGTAFRMALVHLTRRRCHVILFLTGRRNRNRSGTQYE